MADKNVIRQDVVQIGFDVNFEQFRQLEESMDSFCSEMPNLDNEIQQTADKLSKMGMSGSKSTDGMKKKFGETEESVKGFGNSSKQAGEDVDGMGKKSLGAANSLNNLIVAAGGLKILDFVKNTFKETSQSAIEFESAITGVYKTVDGTPQQLEQISSDIKDMTVNMPATTTEIAGVAEAAGQLGIATDGVTNFTKVMIGLSEATNLTGDEAASNLAKFANITGMSADNYERLGSTIVDLGNHFATTEADIVQISTRMASAASIAGLTETNILAISAALSSVGVEGDAAGSAMSTLISNMQTAVETGSDKLNQFASVAGMTSEQFRQAFSEDAASALYAFIDGLNDVERNGASATVVLDDMGIKEIRLSNAIKALASNSSGLADALDVSAKAWDENTALANEVDKRYGTLESKLQMTKNAANNLKIAVGDTLTPALGDLSDMGTSVLNGLSGMAEEFPSLTAGVMGFGGTFGTVISGLAMGIPTINAAIQAFQALELSTKALAIGGGIIGGIALLAGVGAGLYTYFSNAKEAVEDYDGTLSECRQELEYVTAAHEQAIKDYGKNSDAVKDLEQQMDKLNAQYEKGGGALGELQQEIDETSKAIDDLIKSQEEAVTGFDDTERSGLQAVSMLEALSGKTQITNTDLDMMQKYADYLNDTFNCNIEVNYDTKSLTDFDPKNIIKDIEEKSERNKYEVATSFFSNPDVEIKWENAYKQLDDAQNEYNHRVNEYNDYLNKIGTSKEDLRNTASAEDILTAWLDDDSASRQIEHLDKLQEQIDNSKSTLNSAKDEFQKLNVEIDKNSKFLNDNGETAEFYQKKWELTALGVEDAADKIGKAFPETLNDFFGKASEDSEKMSETNENVKGSFEIAGDAVNQYTDQLYQLAEQYDEVYEACDQAVEGQYAAWEQVGEIASMSSEDLLNSLESQNEYWSNYTSNLEILQQKASSIDGLSDMLANMADGTEESAAAIEALANATPEQLQSIASEWQQLNTTEDEAKSTMAQTQTQITDEIEKLRGNVQDSIDGMVKGMNQTTLAGNNARSTANAFINNFVNTLNTRKGEVDSAVNALIQSANSSMAKINIPLPETSVNVSGHANGTINGEDVYIAGEEGPELIVGKKGSTVFPKGETDKIISAVQSYTPESSAVENQKTVNYNNNTTYAPQFVLNMNGSSANNDTKRKIKRWVKESMNEVFEGMANDNQPLIEV